jgi:hypothetical protein
MAKPKSLPVQTVLSRRQGSCEFRERRLLRRRTRQAGHARPDAPICKFGATTLASRCALLRVWCGLRESRNLPMLGRATRPRPCRLPEWGAAGEDLEDCDLAEEAHSPSIAAMIEPRWLIVSHHVVLQRRC